MSRHPVLKLEVAGRTLERTFSRWRDLEKAKDLIKPFARYDPSTRVWRAKSELLPVREAAEAIAESFSIPLGEAARIVEAHNRALLERLRKAVEGTPRIISPTRLDDETFRLVARFARKTGFREFEFDEGKLLARLGVVGRRWEEYEEEVMRWLDQLEERGLILDRSAILVALGGVRGKLSELRRVLANLVQDERGRTWVRLEFNPELREVGGIREWIFERCEVPYNVSVFEAGERRLRQVTIRAARRGETRNVLYLAPWLYAAARRWLEEQGFEFEEKGFASPSTRSELPLDLDLENRLRPYQRDALRKWIENGCRGCIAMPTGAGKTWVALAAIAKLRCRTAIFVPTINLAEQWRKFLAEVLGLPPSMVGILGGGRNELGRPVLVATYDSGVRYAKEIAKLYAFYVFDEGHHVAAETFKEIAWHMLAPYVMVLSATIERDDRNEEMIYRMCGGKVYEVGFEELAKQGWLAPLEVYVVKVPLEGEERERYEAMERELRAVKRQLARLLARARGRAMSAGFDDPVDYLRRVGDPEYKSLASRASSLVARMRVLEQRNSLKTPIAVGIASALMGSGSKVMIFTNLEEQADEVYRELSKRYPSRVALITGRTSEGERIRAFDAFRKGDLRCIVTTTVLDEGVDAPAADAAIIVSSRAIKHPRQYVQRIGRVLRPVPGKVARIFVLRTCGVGGVEEETIGSLVRELKKVYGRDRQLSRLSIVDAEELLQLLCGREDSRGKKRDRLLA